MNAFEAIFDLVDTGQEIPVCCPFPHKSGNLEYFEQHASAHVNLSKKLFHCKVCGVGYNEQQFIEHYFGCTYIDSLKLQSCFETEETVHDWVNLRKLSDDTVELIQGLGISEKVMQDLLLRTNHDSDSNTTVLFPVFVHNTLLDIRKYSPGQSVKIKSRTGTTSGLVIPYDLWRKTPEKILTLICAGEKDMAVARSHGFNAITITGGEKATPKLINAFKNRHVAIVYDNDEAGKVGALKLANFLTKHNAAFVKVVTSFHEVCCEPGEDITDFFVKYKKTKEDLIDYIKDTPAHIYAEIEQTEKIPFVTLLEATEPQHLNKLLESNVQIVAVSEATYTLPTHFILKKLQITGSGDTMSLNQIREWRLSKENVAGVLHLIDNNFKETDIKNNMKKLCNINQKERYVGVQIMKQQPVFKAYLTDMFETQDIDIQPLEFQAYAIGIKLESGKKYKITYKIVPHPYKGNQLIMLILNAKQANDSVTNFVCTDQVQQNLKIFQNLHGSVNNRITQIAEQFKGILGYDGDNTLITVMDLAYHTPLMFHFGSFKNVRAYLDTIVIGESRIGKSSTAEAMRNTYSLGMFVSLAGNSATVPGLIGGSNKVGGSYQTRAGLIPQNHRGLIIFEEFGKSRQNITGELTDIRSSNEVRIARVSGSITLPAMVRMITLTNVKNQSGIIKPIASYPNGIEIVTELVEAAEDIARYDLILVVAENGAKPIDPLWKPQEPFPLEVYRDRVRWVWSRTADQIRISPEISQYIVEQANLLNKKYACHIKLFGTEAWKKIARVAIAVAGYLVSTDETYQNILVEKEHVSYAVQLFEQIYNNDTFKLVEYVQNEQMYSVIDTEGVANLQNIYNAHPSLIIQLEQTSSITKNTLEAVTGMNKDDLNKALNLLTRSFFIRFARYDILPTERFRKGLGKIERKTHVPKLDTSY